MPEKFEEGSVENALFDVSGHGRDVENTYEERAWIINIGCQKTRCPGYSAEIWTYAGLTYHFSRNAEEDDEIVHVLSCDETPGIR